MADDANAAVEGEAPSPAGETQPPAGRAWFPVDPEWDAPQLVDELLGWAAEHRATDVHLSPHADGDVVRARIDGELQDIASVGPDLFPRLVARVKVLAELDLAEHRRPQDGRFAVLVDERHVDLRVSILPTLRGESAVIRLLDREIGVRTLDEIGLSRREVAQVRSLVSSRGGLIVVSGPSGAGKTTTLNAALLEIASPEHSVITIEDPVEYELPNASQCSVRPELGVDFAYLLRGALRHDPDVILVGEVRDPETAQVAVGAALSGHLVLTSLHTQRAADAVVALQQYGIQPYALAPSLRLVIAQQLVRVVCPDCRSTFEYGEQVLRNPNVAEVVEEGETPTFSIGMGCAECLGKGYRGRRGIFELMEVDDRLREVLYQGGRAAEIEATAIEGGMVPLPAKGYRAVVEGLTTVEEIVRAIALD